MKPQEYWFPNIPSNRYIHILMITHTKSDSETRELVNTHCQLRLPTRDRHRMFVAGRKMGVVFSKIFYDIAYIKNNFEYII